MSGPHLSCIKKMLVEQCKNCASRFEIFQNKRGELVVKPYTPFDKKGQCGTYEDKPKELFMKGDFKCPAYRNLLEEMIAWAQHVPNWYNDGELTTIDDEDEGNQ